MDEYNFLIRSADIHKYINNELQSIGFPELDLSNTSSTLATIFSLLKQRQRDLQYRNDLLHRNKSLESNNQSQSTQISKQRALIQAKGKEINDLKFKIDNLDQKTKDLSKIVNGTKDELRKVKTSLSFYKTHFDVFTD